MGVADFGQVISGPTAEEAFERACENAAYEHGHGGYTGTLAEKRGSGFVWITHSPMSVGEAAALAEQLIAEEDPRIADKWGPAGLIPVSTGKRETDRWYVFGWASC